MAKPSIKVEGLRELKREMNQIGDAELKRELRSTNKAAAAIVANQARVEVPKRSGRLAASIRAIGALEYAVVRGGTPSRVPYAGPIHFGWPKRNIRPQPFIYEAMDVRIEDVRKAYEKAMDKLTRKI
jgi:hypothetical protein